MPDWAPLDVAIGLSLLYFLLSIFASAANEGIQTALGTRAKYLERWLLNVFQDATSPEDVAEADEIARERLKAFYANPLVQPLIGQPRPLKTGSTRQKRPSYVAPEVFSAVCLAFQEGAVAAKTAEDVIAAMPSAKLQAVARSLAQDGDDAAKLRGRIERWFDSSMERVSGWYKRRVQLFLAAIGVVIVILVNADTLQVVSGLWSEKTVRAAVVAEADKVTAAGNTPSNLGDVAKEVGNLRELNVPLGWNFKDDDPRGWPNGWRGWLAKMLGLSLTALALTLGAPFWFDLLSKVARLRGSGAPPPATGATRTGEGEQTRAGPAG